MYTAERRMPAIGHQWQPPSSRGASQDTLAQDKSATVKAEVNATREQRLADFEPASYLGRLVHRFVAAERVARLARGTYRCFLPGVLLGLLALSTLADRGFTVELRHRGLLLGARGHAYPSFLVEFRARLRCENDYAWG
jgi:hypothetical protein